MKILFVSSGNSKFGISPLIKSQGESLIKNKIEIQYFLIKGRGLINYLINVFYLKKHLKINYFNIIHAHYGLCGIVAQLARFKEKLVVSFMGDDLIGAVTKNGNYGLFGNALVFLNKLFLSKYDYVIVKSHELSEKVNTQNKAVIPNGVDLNTFYELDKKKAKEKLNIDYNKKIIIFVSNPTRPEKNFNLAKDSVASLQRNDIILLTVNSVPQEELNYYYSAADILLLTSIHEGSPNVIKEAMACNCPIVSTDVGDVKWIIGDVEGCFLVRQKSNEKGEMNNTDIIKEISAKVQAALEFAEKTGRTKGRDRIIELGLDSETIAKKIISIYEQVLTYNLQ